MLRPNDASRHIERGVKIGVGHDRARHVKSSPHDRAHGRRPTGALRRRQRAGRRNSGLSRQRGSITIDHPCCFIATEFISSQKKKMAPGIWGVIAIPLTGGLFRTIYGFFKLANQMFAFPIRETFGLFHI